MIDKSFALQIGAAVPPLPVDCTEGDTAWRWHFQLYLGGLRWTIPTGGAATFTGRKSDGNVFDITATISDNEVVVTANEQVTAYPGPVHCVVRVLDSYGKIVASCPVTLHCRPNPQSMGTLSDTVLSAYDDAIARLGDAIGVRQNVTDWLDEHISGEGNVAVDNSLSVSGAAADAKATGDAVDVLKSSFSDMKFLAGNQVIALTSADFEQGRYDYETGGKISTAAHIRTIRKYRVNPLKPLLYKALPSETFSVAIIQFDENMEFISGGKASSNPAALSERTRFVAFGLYKGGGATTSVSDLTSFAAYSTSGLGLELTADSLPQNTVTNLCMESRITVYGFIRYQMYNRGTGNLSNSENYSRSAELIPAKSGVGYLSNDPDNVTLVCYDKDLGFLGWAATNGTAVTPANTAFIGVNANSLTVESVMLTEVDPSNYLQRNVILDLGGIGSNGSHVPGYKKDAYSYRRTGKYIPVKGGSAFSVTYASGVLTVFEYDGARAMIRSYEVTSGTYYALSDTAAFIKLESYTAPTLVRTPAITVGAQNFASDGGAWEYTADSNRCYTESISADAEKNLLVKCADGIEAWVNLSYVDGTALSASGWLNGNPILDYFGYLDIAYRFSIMCKKTNGGTFSTGDAPVTIYELTENPNISVSIRYAPDSRSPFNKLESGHIPLTYPVGALLGGNRIEQLCYTNGLLRLPPNYDPEGDPVPLIYFAHGSSSYQTLNSSVISSSHEPFLQYLLDEGYAIFDCYGWANVLSYTVGSQWAGHIGMACVTQGIEHVLRNYNIDKNNIFVMGKSLGGLQALNMAFESGLNVKAVGPFAPAIDTLDCVPGYRHLPRRAVFIDFGLPLSGNDENLRFAESVALNAAPAAYQNIISQNASAFVGYNPAWRNLIGLDPDEMVDAEIHSSGYLGGANNVAEIVAAKSRICNTPVKIWVAPDDTAVSYQLADAFVQSIKNSGGRAELRTMPNGTGGHGSTDTDANAQKVASITTKLGIEHTNVPVAYVEVVEWFRQFEPV